jgi:hypothetical protein
VLDDKLEPPFLPWMLDFHHGKSAFTTSYSHSLLSQTNYEQKSKKISVICSDKTKTVMQRQRLEFVRRLKSILGDELDWFGAGINPLDRKIDGLRDYEFSICMENRQSHNIFSEKIIDPILTNTVPIYFGAPNVADFFDVTSILEFQKMSCDSIKEITDIIKNKEYNDFIIPLRRNKDLCLNKHNWLIRAIEKLEFYGSGPTGRISTRILVSLRTKKILCGAL